MTHVRSKPAGQPRQYGVLVGDIKDGQEYGGGNSPHYEIWVVAGEKNYRIAVNVQSVNGSNVVAYYAPKYTSPTSKLNLQSLGTSAPGFTPLPTGSTGQGLDYLRDNLFPLNAMAPIPAVGPGITLSNLLDGQIERAKADQDAVIIAFGEFFHDGGTDRTFGFSPELGVHDIHMMQGNSGNFADDNRINGDGALFIRFSGGETIALFVRFDTQLTNTDDSGNPIQ